MESIEQTWSVDVTDKQVRKQAKRMRKLQKKKKKQQKSLEENGMATNATDFAPLTADTGCSAPTFLAARGVHFDSKRTISDTNIYPTGTKLVLG